MFVIFNLTEHEIILLISIKMPTNKIIAFLEQDDNK